MKELIRSNDIILINWLQVLLKNSGIETIVFDGFLRVYNIKNKESEEDSENSSSTVNIKEIQRLAEKFYNDTYLVDQNACSSPHLIIWMGNQINKGRKKFWKSILKIASYKFSPFNFGY